MYKNTENTGWYIITTLIIVTLLKANTKFLLVNSYFSMDYNFSIKIMFLSKM